MNDFKWRHFAGEVILHCVRLYCKYGISYRDLAAMMEERGIGVDQTPLYRWVPKIRPGPTLSFKPMKTAYAALKGFEVMRMFRKGQFAAWYPGEGVRAEVCLLNLQFGIYGA